MQRQPTSSRVTAPRFQELLAAAIAELRGKDGESECDTVLYLGQRHQAFPSLIVEDPVLEPVDKLVWMTIWQRGAGGSTQALFPTYAEISANAHIRSDTTIARALAILRATRWLSLCARVRGKRGRFRGNVYAVHDEPLPLTDTLPIDPGYLQFVETAKTHPHPRVAKVAAGVLAALDADIHSGVDVMASDHPMFRRLEARHAIAHPGAFRYFSFTPEVLQGLANTRDGSERALHLQDLETADRLQDLETVGSSSSININKTTTTDRETTAPARGSAPAYPPGLTENQRALARRYLERVPPPSRQAVLDELEGRLRAARKGAKPLYDPLRYLHRLCSQVVQGRFVVNLGSQVEAERLRRYSATRVTPTTQPTDVLPTLNAKKALSKAGKSPVAGIREQFKLPTRLKAPT